MAAPQPRPAPDDSVPWWLAAIVVGLLIAVLAAGGVLVRTVLVDDAGKSPEQLEIERLRDELAANPDDLGVRMQYAYALRAAGETQESVREYERILEEDPANPSALYQAGSLLLELGETEDGQQKLWAALEADPTNALAADELARLFEARGDWRSVLAALEPTLEVRPQDADLNYLAGVAHEQLGNVDEAVEHYRAALAYVPDMSEAKEALEKLGETP